MHTPGIYTFSESWFNSDSNNSDFIQEGHFVNLLNGGSQAIWEVMEGQIKHFFGILDLFPFLKSIDMPTFALSNGNNKYFHP